MSGASQLDELVAVVLAPNPSPMTLEGTNTYILTRPGSGDAVVVDPGPELPDHRAAIEAAIAERDAQPVAVVLTHHHRDHAAAAGWSSGWGAQLYAFAPSRVPGDAVALRDGAAVRAGGVVIAAVHTPGHASDHLCLRIEDSGAVLTGDHVLGRGTTVVYWPDGDMGAYMTSLRRLAAIGAPVLYPGHGPTVEDPAVVVAEYLAHREEREAQVLAAIDAGERTAGAIVARVYAEVDAVLHPAAERSVKAHLKKLAAEGRIPAGLEPAAPQEERHG